MSFRTHLDNNLPSFTNSKKIEQAIHKAKYSILTEAKKTAKFNTENSVWINEHKSDNCKIEIPFSRYATNEYQNSVLENNKRKQGVSYHQNTKRLGDILIKEKLNISTRPTPQIIIPQESSKPVIPITLHNREVPPNTSKQHPPGLIKIRDKFLPTPLKDANKIPVLAEKRQPLLTEKWPPYEKLQRKVILDKKPEPGQILLERKVVIQSKTPNVNINENYKNLGIINADPDEYKMKYGSTIKNINEFPDYAKNIRPPKGYKLAADAVNSDYQKSVKLVGDLFALNFVDLDREGLSEYKKYCADVTSNNVCPNNSNNIASINSRNVRSFPTSSYRGIPFKPVQVVPSAFEKPNIASTVNTITSNNIVTEWLLGYNILTNNYTINKIYPTSTYRGIQFKPVFCI